MIKRSILWNEIKNLIVVDPMTEKHPDYNPIANTSNNSIYFIDPKGRVLDKEDETKTMRWFNSNKYNKGFRHIRLEVMKGKDHYRKDGSVLFASQKNAIKYMISPSTKKGDKKEQFAFIKDSKMLVTPEKYNDGMNCHPDRGGYKYRDGIFFDPVKNRERIFDSTVHTHPSSNRPSGNTTFYSEPDGDKDTQTDYYPSKPEFILASNSGSSTMYYKFNILANPKVHLGLKILTVQDLISGKQFFPKYKFPKIK
jgi:competence CoiA-like predicted nuclease